jgi:hypothetical protein
MYTKTGPAHPAHRLKRNPSDAVQTKRNIQCGKEKGHEF